MAIGFDNATYGTGTLSHTNAGNAMVVFTRSDATPTLAYGGDSLTGLGDVAIGTGQNISAFYLNNPKSGANNLVPTGGTNVSGIAILTYTGVKQSGQPKTTATHATVGTTPTVAITIATANSWGIVGLSSDNGTSTSNTNWATRGSVSSQINAGDSGAGLSTGSITFSGTYASGTAKSAMWAFELEAIPSVTNGNFFEIL